MPEARGRRGTLSKEKAQKGWFLETLKTVVYAVLIALGIRTIAFEPFNIPSASMLPTLLVGDYLFVSKYSYGYSRHSIPLSPPLFEGRVLARPLERGDIAVFKLPRDNKTDYIKRIVGLPGDRLQMQGGVLYINDVAVKRELWKRLLADAFGTAFLGADDQADLFVRHTYLVVVAEVIAGVKAPVETFGQEKDATWRAINIDHDHGCYTFDVEYKGEFFLRANLANLPGRHQISNALVSTSDKSSDAHDRSFLSLHQGW